MENTKEGETEERGDILNGWGKLNGTTGNYIVNNGSIMGDGRYTFIHVLNEHYTELLFLSSFYIL